MLKSDRLVVFLLAVIVPASIICGVMYVAVQQSLRQSANDPQIQLAEDNATALAGSSLPEEVIGDTTIDASKSLAPFIMIYDNEGKFVSSNATFAGKDLEFPIGVLDYAKLHGQRRVTWQTASGLRFAAVAQRSGGNFDGYVVAARSLREVEQRESQAFNVVMAAWLILLASGGATVGWLMRTVKHKKTA